VYKTSQKYDLCTRQIARWKEAVDKIHLKFTDQDERNLILKKKRHGSGRPAMISPAQDAQLLQYFEELKDRRVIISEMLAKEMHRIIYGANRQFGKDTVTLRVAMARASRYGIVLHRGPKMIFA
jgi:hypothetical protein